MKISSLSINNPIPFELVRTGQNLHLHTNCKKTKFLCLFVPETIPQNTDYNSSLVSKMRLIFSLTNFISLFERRGINF